MRRRRAPRIRTASLGAACAVMLMLTVGTVALVAVSGGGDRSLAAFTADEPTLGVAPTISASPSPSPSAAPSTTPPDDAGGYREPADASTAPEPSRAPRSESSSRPSPSATASNETAGPEGGEAPEPERSPGVLESIVGGLFGG